MAEVISERRASPNDLVGSYAAKHAARQNTRPQGRVFSEPTFSTKNRACPSTIERKRQFRKRLVIEIFRLDARIARRLCSLLSPQSVCYRTLLQYIYQTETVRTGCTIHRIQQSTGSSSEASHRRSCTFLSKRF